jgi:hypothetical protein
MRGFIPVEVLAKNPGLNQVKEVQFIVAHFLLLFLDDLE